jgi:hypothetical protein
MENEEEYLIVLIEGDGLYYKGEVYFVPVNSEVAKILEKGGEPSPDVEPQEYIKFLEKIREQAVKSISVDHNLIGEGFL